MKKFNICEDRFLKLLCRPYDSYDIFETLFQNEVAVSIFKILLIYFYYLMTILLFIYNRGS